MLHYKKIKYLRYSIYLPYLIFLFLIKKPKKIIIVFGSRFGHFLCNTEFFINESEKYNQAKTDYIFISICKTIDSYDLKDLIQNVHNIKIITGMYGFSIYLYAKIMQAEIIDIRSKTQPAQLVKSKCAAYIKKIESDKLQITFSLRNGNYSKLIQKDKMDSTFRDTPLYTLESSLDYLIKRGYEVSLINKCINSKDVTRLGVKDRSQENLKTRWGRLKGASFHISTATGLDLLAPLTGIPSCTINNFFGCALDSRFYIKNTVSFMLPMLMYSKRNGSFLSMSEKIEFLKKIEEKFCYSGIVNEGLMSMEGLIYVPNSEANVFLAIKELEEYILNKSPPTSKQKKFWEDYPKTWTNKSDPEVVFHKYDDESNLRISQIYLEKFNI